MRTMVHKLGFLGLVMWPSCTIVALSRLRFGVISVTSLITAGITLIGNSIFVVWFVKKWSKRRTNDG